MKRLLMLALVLCLSLPAYAANPVESAQEKISIYLGQLDAMCNQQAFLTYGFAQEPGKSWKAGLEELEAELKGNAELPRMLQGTPRLLIHLGLQTINAKKCLPKDDWNRKNVTDELGSYANPSPATSENVTPRPAVWNESPMEIIERYNSLKMRFVNLRHILLSCLPENSTAEKTLHPSRL